MSTSSSSPATLDRSFLTVLLTTATAIAVLGLTRHRYFKRSAKSSGAAAGASDVPTGPPLPVKSSMGSLEVSPDNLVSLLRKLIGEAKSVQNFPPDLIPQEGNVVRHLVEELKPYSTENGGPIEVRVISYVPNRSNLIVTYKSKNPKAKNISLIGMHLDVVPADPATWRRNPFQLEVEGDDLFGRGTTDCLGHVALVTLLLKELAVRKIELDNNVVAVFIAAEENDSIKGVGIDGLSAAGELDALKSGPLIWVDSSDSQPCMGTAGAIGWKLTATGKRFHSGLPHNTVNSIELGMNAVEYVQKRFYESFPPHPDEARYKFATPSTLKPTIAASAPGSLNQIPPTFTVSGDIRLTPFYDIDVVVKAVDSFVAEINANPAILQNAAELGPSSRFVGVKDVPARVELEWLSKDLHALEGIACNINSKSFQALAQACERVVGKVQPFSINGSLPLVRKMHRQGFDLQLIGFGLSATYHADNESAKLTDLLNGVKILSQWIGALDLSLKN